MTSDSGGDGAAFGIPPLDPSDPELLLALLQDLPPELIDIALDSLTPAQLAAVMSTLPAPLALLPVDPGAFAAKYDPSYVSMPHLAYLAERLRIAVKDVEEGRNRRIAISMPPRSGKSVITSKWFPSWLLSQHPDWKLGMVSYSPSLVNSWSRAIRAFILAHGTEVGLAIPRGSGAIADWRTTAEGEVHARSGPGQAMTGFGAKVLIVDDLVKDAATAASAVAREIAWTWWTGSAVTRLEPPSLVIFIGTRWHQDDVIGRLRSVEHNPDAADWEIISFPAIADHEEGLDILGRAPGDPLYTPLLPDETREEALDRWSGIRRSVGSYNWSSQFQQSPSPASGAIFNLDWIRYWTDDRTLFADALANGSDNLVYLDPSDPEQMTGFRWLDSWDAAFKGLNTSDYVVGQRWARRGPDRFLIYQVRDRLSFTETEATMRSFFDPLTGGPGAARTREHLIEDKANGTAIIDVLKKTFSGIVPISPKDPKDVRARAVTPEMESGNVYLPHPAMPGYEWVPDLISELRDFPRGTHDDQVDCLTQALGRLANGGRGSVRVPGAAPLNPDAPGGVQLVPSKLPRVLDTATAGSRSSDPLNPVVPKVDPAAGYARVRPSAVPTRIRRGPGM